MNTFATLVASALLAGLPVLADAFTARNYHKVGQISDDVFEVVGRPGSGGQEFWCAAGDYARRMLGAKASQRVYLVRGPGVAQTRNRNRAVLFSLTPPEGGDTRTTLFLSVKTIGSNLNVSMASNYCYRDIDR